MIHSTLRRPALWRLRTRRAARMLRTLRSLLLLPMVAALAAGCGTDSTAPANPGTPPGEIPTPSPVSLDGSWRALYWIVQSPSGAVFDVITEGGSIVLQVKAHVVTGSMHVPENVTNGAPTTVNMSGSISIQGDNVRFNQAEDTFVQRAVWKLHPGNVFDSLVLANEDVEGARFTVVLVRNW